MNAQRAKKSINVSLDPKVLDALDKWIDKQEFTPSRNTVIEELIKKHLSRKVER